MRGVLDCVCGSDPVSELTGLRIEWLSTRVRRGVANTLAGLVDVRLNSEKTELGFLLRVQTSVITPNGIKQEERGWYIIIHNVTSSRDRSALTSSRIISAASRWGLCNAKRRHGLPCLQGSLGNFPPPATRAALPERLRPETYFT